MIHTRYLSHNIFLIPLVDKSLSDLNISCVFWKMFPFYYTVGPRKLLFYSTSFHCNVDERKKLIPSWGYCVWTLYVLPMSTWVFLCVLWFPPMSQRCVQLVCLNCLCMIECVCVCVSVPCDGMSSCPSSPYNLTAGIGSSHPWPSNGISRLENNYLTCFY